MKNILLLLLLPLITFAQKEVVIHITTDNYPAETKWELFSDSVSGTLLSAVNYGHYTSASTTYSDTVYISDTITNISWVIYDSYGDGIPGGNYYVSVCEDTIISYPVPTFTTGLLHNRVIPQCMPNPPPCVEATVIINLDQYQGETSWDITDTNGTVYASSVAYDGNPDYATIIIPVCIPKGPLEFNIYDTYGDGLNGALWQGQDGSYYLTQCNDTLIYGTDPAFGYDTAHVFVSDSCIPIYGCMDPAYMEFNHLAIVDTGFCNILKVFGCVDSAMYNYDSLANVMDMIDSCEYTLILHDLMGNGWVGSSLKLYANDTTEYSHMGGFNDYYYISLTAPRLLSVQFFISPQASLTTIECGFTLINPEGDTLISIEPPFIQPLFVYSAITNCGNICIERVFGCPDTLACNYTAGVNTATSCTYPVQYYDCNNQCIVDTDNDGVCNENEIIGCQDPLFYNYNILATDPGLCIPFIYGCIDATQFNYDANANTSNESCEPYIYGCMDSTAFNYNLLANTDNGTCDSIIDGCTNPVALNYNPLANTDDGSCINPVYGCIDSTMFNYNSLANVDNNSCISYFYGCTNPTALNYNPLANTEDFSCIDYIYGCTDSTAFNYDSTANTNNNSCVVVVEGCMDQSAYNYNNTVNVHDSISCLYSASCTSGPGNPYWLNDPCYAWVISVDDYCCDNEWDTICQLTYDYCEGTWSGPLLSRTNAEKKLLKITDILGRPTKEIKNQLLFYIYDDGSINKKIIKH